MTRSLIVRMLVIPLFLLLTQTLVHAEPAAPAKIDFTEETLPNGLRVIYAPLHQAPVVHVRVLYHVGSRDERPDRQGFAHMFEHMMFRGSAHVAPEEHMKLINGVGGICNAFTSFDQTTYHQSLPAENLDMALYLEADRMASFKVDDNIYQTERNVVAKEWGIRQNRPYGTLYEDFLGIAFTKHSYRWTPIGNMDHLKAAPVSELQAFFNKYYVPNNAVLVIAGDIDVDKTRVMVKTYFSFIPEGEKIEREIPAEPEQTQQRVETIKRLVPLPAIVMGTHLPPYGSDDHYALAVLGSIMGDGRTSRLDRRLVNTEQPLCTDVSAGPFRLQDGGVFVVFGTVLLGKKSEDVQAAVVDEMNKLVQRGIRQDELDKAKIQARKSIVAGRDTAEHLAIALGEAELFARDAERVNQEWSKLDALTVDDVNAVAKKYLDPNRATILSIMPDVTAAANRQAAAKTNELKKAGVAPSTEPVAPRAVTFPQNYPTTAPVAASGATAEFKKGIETNVNGVRVIVMSDHRLPIIMWNLTMRRGSHLDPPGKEGLGKLTAALVRRGSGEMTFDQLNEDLESRGIAIETSDGGDLTRLSGSCMTDQAGHALQRTRQILLQPTFPAGEFAKIKEQTISQLAVARENPATVADIELKKCLFGGTPLGRESTPESVAAITLEGAKKYYATVYKPNEAILVLAGDVSVEQGAALAKTLLDGWKLDELPAVDYTLPESSAHKIILVDNPAGKQSVLRIGLRAYNNQSEDRFAGLVAGQILSYGIESRLNKYVRAEKGYVYGIGAYFQPGRHAGLFNGMTETGFDTTVETLQAMYKVFDDMRTQKVKPEELSTAKTRVAGSLVMETQTIEQQAGRRVDAILNGYSIDYYDTLPARIAQVTQEQIQDVMNRYVKDDQFNIVVIAPAEKVKEKLIQLGEVQMMPMPSKRAGAASRPTEMLK